MYPLKAMARFFLLHGKMIEIGACSSSVLKTASLRSLIAGPESALTVHVNTPPMALTHCHAMVGCNLKQQLLQQGDRLAIDNH
jgi:hypothetical protein